MCAKDHTPLHFNNRTLQQVKFENYKIKQMNPILCIFLDFPQNSFAENARLLKETNVDMREHVRTLQNENESKTAKIQALEKRIKELEQ